MSSKRAEGLRHFLDEQRDAMPTDSFLREWIATGTDLLERREKLGKGVDRNA